MIIYDAFYLLDTCRIINRIFNFREPKQYDDGAICIPPQYSLGDTVWAEIDCEPERERYYCKLCKTDLASHIYGKPIRGHGVMHGEITTENFIPTHKIFDDVLVSKNFVIALLQTSFKGYEFFPYNIYSLALYTDTDILPLEIFGLDCRGKTKDVTKQQEYAQKYPYYCIKCHWGPRWCPECLNFFYKCPVCGCQEFESNIPESKCERESEIINLTYVDEKEVFVSILCEEWDGSDFLEGNIITGQVAKWLVENQYGPVFLLPYPADISCCSKEQLEKIDTIRYIPHT
jgi:hypothetical protein